ncbi:conserved hypothetical protein [Halobacteriovorax marinus SJ]|uniref:SAM-dependent methyltransferase n=1 Tax=Halobacteriovorax marinus (strain ATCC BAA-682 / DSM 15412 / SJ) TaxID=862908 RepID=E1X204_HALMS|nr:tRNA (adenine(22)-N(1))-methyltransferase TrmK [Halobacteriovorax marinus]CBW26664.1 conserved hypothetical protein [Halobacteriovorax marinus SJ]
MSNTKRIPYLINLIDKEYSYIWDLCCDHGNIGIGLGQKFPSTKIIFNDIIPSITNALREKLESLPNLNSKRFKIITASAKKLKIDKDNSLVIIAGVGGRQAREFLEEILRSESQNFDLLLCTHYQQEELREFLIQKNFGLLRSELIFDKLRPYEVLYVSREVENDIPSFSTELLNRDDVAAREYFTKKYRYLEKKRNKSENELKAQEEIKGLLKL